MGTGESCVPLLALRDFQGALNKGDRNVIDCNGNG